MTTKTRRGYFKDHIVKEMRRDLGEPDNQESFFVWEIMEETGASRPRVTRWLREKVSAGEWRTARKNGKPSFIPTSKALLNQSQSGRGGGRPRDGSTRRNRR